MAIGNEEGKILVDRQAQHWLSEVVAADCGRRFGPVESDHTDGRPVGRDEQLLGGYQDGGWGRNGAKPDERWGLGLGSNDKGGDDDYDEIDSHLLLPSGQRHSILDRLLSVAG